MTDNPGDQLPPIPEGDYTEGAVPTFDYVRDKIEQRSLTAEGATELAGLGTEHNLAALDKQMAERDQAAKDKLAEIRRSMGKE